MMRIEENKDVLYFQQSGVGIVNKMDQNSGSIFNSSL
jgi:hypothetical protein